MLNCQRSRNPSSGDLAKKRKNIEKNGKYLPSGERGGGGAGGEREEGVKEKERNRKDGRRS